MGYTVYKHTTPSGKVYIGITSQNVDRRWHNGEGYKGCTLFYRAVKKYGWDKISHDILFTGLSADEAKTKKLNSLDFMILQIRALDIISLLVVI